MKTTKADLYDVIVFGGGPAGSTAGNLLARQGRRVLVLEKERFPRHHIGESLLPGLNYLYRRLGVRDILRREGFFRKTGGSYIWGKTRDPWSITFIQFDEAPVPCATSSEVFAYHVDRGRFDELLLRQCAKVGAEVRQKATVVDIGLKGETVTGVTYRTADGRRRRAEASFYLDASGQAALIPNRLGWRAFDPQLRHMAVYTYFKGAKLLEGARRNHIFVVNIPDGWLWYIPISAARVNVGVVTSIDKSKEAGRDLERFLMDRVRGAPEIARLMKRARRVERLRVERDWSYRSRRFAGDNFLLLGDAAAFVDPLLSYGVTLAMHSGALAADCVDIALGNPERRKRMIAHYDEVHARRFDELLEFVKYFYDGNRDREEYFWKARRVVRHVRNRYSKCAFTYLVSGYTMWDKVLHKPYFARFFAGLGAPVEKLKGDKRFLRAAAGLQASDLPPMIDEAFPAPPGAEKDWARRSVALRIASAAIRGEG
jgi:flavin-dependent dehydrogenase